MVTAKRNISFNPELHRYTDEYNHVYTSVTTLIGQYVPKFDENYWAKYKADQAGISPETVKANWKAIRDHSCEKGTKEHNLLEDSINASIQRGTYKLTDNPLLIGLGIIINKANLDILKETPLAKKYPTIYKYLEAKILDGWSLHAEKRIYWADYLIAGTIDCLLIKGKKFIIVDWKTNKDELKFKAGYYKKVNGIKTDLWVDKKEYFFKPLSTIEHCKGMIYTMQLSLYAYLLSLWGYECEELVLYHIRDNMEPKAYSIKYMEWACKLLCIDFKNGSSSKSNSKSNSNESEQFGIS